MTITVHSVSLQGKRPSNEDKHVVILNSNNNKKSMLPIDFINISDGHGGSFVAKFVTSNLPQLLLDKRIKYPLNKIFVKKIYKTIQQILRTKYNNQSNHCGATCLAVMHYKKNKQQYLNVLNTGDTRAVLCRKGYAIALTKDHKPNWPDERERIEKLGGKIKFDGDDWRINDLSVSRAFGDIDAEPYVTCLPDLYRYKLDKTDNFLIVACDGVWDVLSNQDAVNFVLNELKNIKSKSTNIARRLGEHALRLGSSDNITIAIMFFN